MTASNITNSKASPRPPVREIFAVFARMSATSFGGGLVAYIRNALVEEKKWMTQEEFLVALEMGQALPGMNAVNVSIIAGRHLGGPLGSIAAASGLLLPGVAGLLAMGWLYNRFSQNPDVTAALAGVAAAAVGLLLQVTLKLGSKQFSNLRDLFFIAATFVMVAFFHLSLLKVLFLTAPLAIILCRPKTPSRS